MCVQPTASRYNEHHGRPPDLSKNNITASSKVYQISKTTQHITNTTASSMVYQTSKIIQHIKSTDLYHSRPGGHQRSLVTNWAVDKAGLWASIDTWCATEHLLRKLRLAAPDNYTQHKQKCIFIRTLLLFYYVGVGRHIFEDASLTLLFGWT